MCYTIICVVFWGCIIADLRIDGCGTGFVFVLPVADIGILKIGKKVY